MAQWDVYRIPVDFAVLRRKDTPDYQTENALFRQMLYDFRRPGWCQEVVVTADAAKWLRVLGHTEPSQIDERVGHQLHAVVPTLEVFETQQQPLEFILPRKRPLHAIP